MKTEFNIEEFLSLADYATEERSERRQGSGGTQEFFTNYVLVKKMCDKISPEKWNDPNANFLEPSAGNGQFVVYIIYNKIKHGSTWEQALSHTWDHIRFASIPRNFLFEITTVSCYNQVCTMYFIIDLYISSYVIFKSKIMWNR